MAWINSLSELPIEPFDLGFKPTNEREFQEWLDFFRNWESLLFFRRWQREYRLARRCVVDFIGYSDDWEKGYLVELKMGYIKTPHKKQVVRYLKNIVYSKSWTRKVEWHGILLCCDNGKIIPHYIGSVDAIS